MGYGFVMSSAVPSQAVGHSRRAAPLPPDERREAIVSRVLPLLIDRGAAATSRQLAAAAGVAEGTIWKVFADKDDLLAMAVERLIDPSAFQRAVEELDPSLPFEERLLATTELLQQRMVGIWRLISQTDADRRSLGDKPLPDNQAVIEVFQQHPDRVRVPPVQAARQLRALVLSLSNPALVDPPLSAAEIVDLFLHGVGADARR